MVQQVTTRSWLSRIIGSLVGVIVGIALIIGAFVLIFSNEHKGLQAAESLHQAEKELIPVSASPVKAENNFKVIYFSGLATTKDILKDPQLGLALNAIKLDRYVKMYQWRENVETHTEKQLGGSEQEVKTYTYETIWSPDIINSADFKDGVGHQNPRIMLISSKSQQAKKVKVGEFTLPASLISKINGAEPVDLHELKWDKIQKKYRKTFQLLNDELYVGADPQHPQVGDLRITVTQVLPQEVSVIAQQNEKTVQPFLAPAGKEVALLVSGTQSPESMIKQALSDNRMMTWLWRIASLVMLIVGIALILNPLAVLGDVIPFVGSLIGFGVGLVAFVTGLLLWSAATAMAWIFVRPVFALTILAAIVVVALAIIFRKKWSKN